jgi:hypothetical protein
MMTQTQVLPYIKGADPTVPGWDRDYRVYTADQRDKEALYSRQVKRFAHRAIQHGDYVQFDDGVVRRTSHIWCVGVQTSDGGSWHLNASGDGSFSGSLYDAVPHQTLSDTWQYRLADFWFFHHDWHKAHNAVYVKLYVRVWVCELAAPR